MLFSWQRHYFLYFLSYVTHNLSISSYVIYRLSSSDLCLIFTFLPNNQETAPIIDLLSITTCTCITDVYIITHTHIYIYIYICVCVWRCVCLCVTWKGYKESLSSSNWARYSILDFTAARIIPELLWNRDCDVEH